MWFKHRHKWITVASDNTYERNFVDAIGKNAKMEVTILLQQCECGDFRKSHVDGKWTPAELGIDAKTVSDLKSMLNELD